MHQRPLSSASASPSRLPVAIFIDLDNVVPNTLSRADIKNLTDPLREFGETAGDLRVVRAFANKNTQLYVSEEERERLSDDEPKYLAWDADEETCQTGLDDQGFLRCGVCGQKMNLTKKDRARGLDVYDKLDKHMRMLHDREQEKRNNRMRMKTKKGKKRPKWAKLGEKEWEKYRKYEAAQVGLHRRPASRMKKNRGGPIKNDAFQILREQGVKCTTAEDVDTALIRDVTSWMSKCTGQGDYDTSVEGIDAQGCVVVVSEDGDFADLLRRKDFITVAATSNSTTQTKKLVEVCDLVLSKEDHAENIDDTVEGVFGPLIAKPVTQKGTLLLEEMEKRSF